MKHRIILFCNGEQVISCDLEGFEIDQTNSVAENLLVCFVSRAIDGLDETEAEKFVQSLKGLDFGVKIEKIYDMSSVPYTYRDGFFDRLMAGLKKFFTKE